MCLCARHDEEQASATCLHGESPPIERAPSLLSVAPDSSMRARALLVSACSPTHARTELGVLEWFILIARSS